MNSIQHCYPHIGLCPVDQLVKHLEKQLQDDQKKTAQIEAMAKAVINLAEKGKRMKGK